MKIQPTSIPDVLLIEPKVFGDPRGFFMETFQKRRFAEAGITLDFVQDNQSGSVRGTLRGLHYQIRQPQGKLMRVAKGEIYDVAVDIRKGSPTFGKWEAVCLSDENKAQLWVPPGFAHGFYVLSEWAEIFYKTTDYYAPEWERTILWNDPDLAITWPVPEGSQPILSQKDSSGSSFREAEIFEF
jgi:dTDP-4-dehydrorhamnose 3,5-epimerase